MLTSCLAVVVHICLCGIDHLTHGSMNEGIATDIADIRVTIDQGERGALMGAGLLFFSNSLKLGFNRFIIVHISTESGC